MMPNAKKTVALMIFGVNFLVAGVVSANTQTVIEDWDSTPPIPDQVRGWGSGLGEAQLESGLGTGNYARAQLVFILPNTLSVPWGNDTEEWLENEFVGNKDYSEMGPISIRYLARHDTVGNFSQVNAVPTSIVLLSSTRVPSPNNPSSTVLPRIWTTSDNSMSLGAGWEEFEFNLPSRSATLPEGWKAWPDSEETWQQVISDVDQVGVVFTEYNIGIGGPLFAWDNAVDNFEITFFGGNAIQVNTLSDIALCLMMLVLLVAAFFGTRHVNGTY